MVLPSEALIREVGPRGGCQNEPEIIPTDAKVRLIEMLARTGLRPLEVTSLANPVAVAARALCGLLGRLLGSHALVAGAVDWHREA